MRILFVRSGNNGIDPISTRQGESLKKRNIEIIYFDIIGKGFIGYLKNIFKLKNCIEDNCPDIIHAHYLYSGILSVLTFSKKPIGISLMGSDVLSSGIIYKIILNLFLKYWDFKIVKSEEIYKSLKNKKNTHIVPNGVDYDNFFPIDKITARKELKWDNSKIHILFASDNERKEKNYELAKAALEILKKDSFNFELHFLKKIPMDKINFYYNATDILLLTSLHEGSPNVIKEAMASNCPIVSTDVGDIKWIFGNTEGNFLCEFNSNMIYEKIKDAIRYRYENIFTKGRERLIQIHLTSNIIAEKLEVIYLQNIKKQ